jgi:hypothetical protein
LQQTALNLARRGNLAERNQQAATEMEYQSNGHHGDAPMFPDEPPEESENLNDIPF